MKKLIKGLLGISLLLTLSISCQSIDVPQVWRCTIYSKSLDCFYVESIDEILEKSLSLKASRGYQCVSPNDARELQNSWDDVVEELLIYRAKYGPLK